MTLLKVIVIAAKIGGITLNHLECVLFESLFEHFTISLPILSLFLTSRSREF